MILDPVRTARQDEIIESWLQYNGVGTAECVTGFGKTFLAIRAIERKQRENPWLTTLVVVPTLYLQQQWNDRIQAHGLERVVVLVINTLVRSTHKVDLLILDELHKYTAEVFGQVFDCVDYTTLLGLTATMPEDDDKRFMLEEHAPIVDTVGLEEALKKKWVSAFTIYNMAVKMTPDEVSAHNRLKKDFNRFFAFFGHDFQLAMSCLNNSAASKSWAKEIQRDEKEVRIYAVQFMRAMRARKELLYGLQSKIGMAAAIIERNKSRKVITFSQSIEAADHLAALVGDSAVVYHSKMKGFGKGKDRVSAKDARQVSIDRFRSDDFLTNAMVLSTAKALDMGADLPEIDMGIVTSGTSTPVQGLQRYGRTIRYVAGKETIIIELYAPDTQDERWLRSRQKKVPKSSIRWIKSIEEIL